MSLHEQWSIRRTDSPEQIAAKIRKVISEKAPDLTEAQAADQALLAWSGIRSEWGWNDESNPIGKVSFESVWGKSANGALDRQAKRQGWGGRRPNAGSGGNRPRTGPLKQTFAVSPFSHTDKGDTESEATITITRCNYCGAWGWSYAEAETLYDWQADEGNRLHKRQGMPEQPIAHLTDCPHK
jgi:hypothetical protein